MKRQVVLLLLLSGSAWSQGASAPASDEAVALVQNTVVRALNFEQGNSPSLNKEHDNFTPSGWNEFMKHMDGFLDPNGAPQFGSKFAAAGDAVVVSKEGSVMRLKIPGTLTQTQGKSSTTYRLRIEVEAAGTPPKIEHLEQVTCDKAAAVKYCM
jgi:hypothetical protein